VREKAGKFISNLENNFKIIFNEGDKILNKIKMILVILIMMSVETYAQQTKIGYVDKIKVLTELESWKNADKRLLKMKEDAEFELVGMTNEADSLNRVLQNQMMLTDAMRSQIQNRIIKLSQDYQKVGVTRQQELIQTENSLKSPILVAFEDIVRDLGIKEDFTFIYDTTINSIVFAAGGRDLTEQVLFELRKKIE